MAWNWKRFGDEKPLVMERVLFFRASDGECCIKAHAWLRDDGEWDSEDWYTTIVAHPDDRWCAIEWPEK